MNIIFGRLYARSGFAPHRLHGQHFQRSKLICFKSHGSVYMHLQFVSTRQGMYISIRKSRYPTQKNEKRQTEWQTKPNQTRAYVFDA